MTTLWQTQLAPMRRVAFDTNALIYLLKGVEPHASLVTQALSLLAMGTAAGVISTIVELELLVKPMRERESATVERIEFFLRTTPNLSVRPVDRMVARRAAEVRARTGISPPDAIIVATALEERCDAIIGNDYVVALRMIGIPYICLDDYV